MSPSYGAVATFKCEMSEGVRLWIWILDHARCEDVRLYICLIYRQNMGLFRYLNMEQTPSLFELAFKNEFYPGPMTKTCMCNIRIFVELAQKSTMAKNAIIRHLFDGKVKLQLEEITQVDHI